MGKVLYMRKGETHTAPVAGIPASDLAVGSTVKLLENGVAVEYLVVHHGKPSTLYDDSCDGLWLLRKEIYETRKWNRSDNNTLETSTTHTYLNSTFVALFDDATQAAIRQVKIPYRKGGGENGKNQSGENGLSCKIFHLSGYEVGLELADFQPQDGAKLTYFESGLLGAPCAKRIAKLNGEATSWMLRSPATNGTGYVQCVTEGGHGGTTNGSATLGVRPSLILPSTAIFDTETLILKGV